MASVARVADPMTTALTPAGHVHSYWAATAGPGPDNVHPLPGDRTVEVAVIGGGYTGLSAAHRLAGTHGIETLVLEANHRLVVEQIPPFRPLAPAEARRS